jgi:UbiD family decarboxylase
MDISAITHRRDPWVVNQFTGVNRGAAYSISHAYGLKNLQARAPSVTALHSPGEAPGLTFVSIHKEKPGQALEVGKMAAETGVIAKVVVVVEDDVDVLDTEAVLHAIGARWQPGSSTSLLLSGLAAHALDPSLPMEGDSPKTNKFVIDATRQRPEEGGPKVYQLRNRTLLEQMAPQAMARVDAKWDELLGDWRPPSV